jgi:hypothetical protein
LASSVIVSFEINSRLFRIESSVYLRLYTRRDFGEGP